MLKKEATNLQEKQIELKELKKAKDRKITALRNDIELLRSDLKSYEKKLQKSTKTIQAMRKKSDQEIIKERNSRNRLVALGQKELERLRNEILEKDSIIENLKLNLNEYNLENQRGNDPKKSIINSLHEKNRQLEKDLDQTKNKMNFCQRF